MADLAHLVLRLACDSGGSTQVRASVRSAWYSGEARAVASASALQSFAAALRELAGSGKGLVEVSLDPPPGTKGGAAISLRAQVHGASDLFCVKLAMPADPALREALGSGSVIMTPSLFCDARALESFARGVGSVTAGCELEAALIGEPGV